MPSFKWTEKEGSYIYSSNRVVVNIYLVQISGEHSRIDRVIIIAFIVHVFIYKPLFKYADQTDVNPPHKMYSTFKQIYYVLLLLGLVMHLSLFIPLCVFRLNIFSYSSVHAGSFDRSRKFYSFPTASAFSCVPKHFADANNVSGRVREHSDV